MSQPTVTVIIAAFNAAATIEMAVRSALAQPEVSEVVVIDDCSNDDTAAVAMSSASDDGRLQVYRQPHNMGPSAARNRAIDESSADIIAILDADDVFLPERFKAAVSRKDWDLCADNILFVDRASQVPAKTNHDELRECLSLSIDAETFIRGNISAHGRTRGELGFLKPLIRREVLERFKLRYDEDCRLGEDFILYCDLLLRGARFKLLPQCGYAALVRHDSLSARHDLSALEALHRRSKRMRDDIATKGAVRSALSDHIAHVHRKILHRRALETRRDQGLLAGLTYAATHPAAGYEIIREKLLGPPARVETPTHLLTRADFARLGRFNLA